MQQNVMKINLNDEQDIWLKMNGKLGHRHDTDYDRTPANRSWCDGDDLDSQS